MLAKIKFDCICSRCKKQLKVGEEHYMKPPLEKLEKWKITCQECYLGLNAIIPKPIDNSTVTYDINKAIENSINKVGKPKIKKEITLYSKEWFKENSEW